jgi:hypothetical protein
VKPETVIKWHRAGFRSYWRWKSRRRGGRPTVAPEIRKLIRERSIANPLWGAPPAGNKLPAISFVTGTGPMVRSSSEGFDQWAFAIDRRRRAPLGKMDMLKG